MYNTTQAYRQAVKEYPQRFKLSIDVIFNENSNLENITIPPEDIFDSSFDESAFALGNFQIGAATGTLFSVRIHNADNKYSNNALSSAEIHPKFTLYDENDMEIDTVPVGVFFTDTINIVNSDLKLDCVDKMNFGGELFNVTGSEDTLYNIATGIAHSMNANLATTPGDISILSKVVNDSIFEKYSLIQVISFIAAASGSFAIFNYAGDLEFKWFKSTGIELRGDWAKKAIELNGNTFTVDNNAVHITGISVTDGDAELAMAGTDNSVLEIVDNPIANIFPQDVASFVLNRIKDTVYIPAVWKRIGGDPSIQVGDILTIIDNKERYNPDNYDQYTKYAFYVSQKNWNFKGSFSDVYESGHMPQKAKNKGMTVSKQVSIMKKQIKEIQADITTGLDDRQQALLLFNEKMYAAMGLYQTVKDDGKGGLINYLHDHTKIEDSMTIYKFSSGGFAWTNTGWNNGNPVWTSGLAENGDAILNQIYAYVISADLIKTGLLKSKNSASWINMDTGTFCFRAVTGGWIDPETGEVTYDYEDRLKLDNNGALNVIGLIKSINYPLLSAAIGQSETGALGAFTVTDNTENFGDIFQTYGSNLVNDKGEVLDRGTIWTAPFLLNADKTNRKGISIFEDDITCFADSGNAILRGDEVKLQAGTIKIETKGDTLNINQSIWDDCRLWINWAPQSVGYRTLSYNFGNNTQGGYALIHCGDAKVEGEVVSDTVWAGTRVVAGSTESFYSNYAASVIGGLCVDGIAVSSDINKKKNIELVDDMDALGKVKQLKFYKYDYSFSESVKTLSTTANSFNSQGLADEIASTPVTHIDIGLMAQESPSEITDSDDLSINLYSYTSLIAKAVQELTEKVETLEAELNKIKNNSPS